MILLDTPAIFALANRADERHIVACELIDRIHSEKEQLLVHNYVLLEAAALLQGRLGHQAAMEFLSDVQNFELVWVTQDIHEAAERYWVKQGKRQLSLTDCVSFVVMLKEQIDTAFTFDKHFKQAGFNIYK